MKRLLNSEAMKVVTLGTLQYPDYNLILSINVFLMRDSNGKIIIFNILRQPLFQSKQKLKQSTSIYFSMITLKTFTEYPFLCHGPGYVYAFEWV